MKIMEKLDVKDRSKAKLIGAIDKEVTAMFEQILNFAEVAVPNKEQYRRLRSKILRLGNDCKRNLRKEIERDYLVTYEASREDFIEFNTTLSK